MKAELKTFLPPNLENYWTATQIARVSSPPSYHFTLCQKGVNPSYIIIFKTRVAFPLLVLVYTALSALYRGSLPFRSFFSGRDAGFFYFGKQTIPVGR